MIEKSLARTACTRTTREECGIALFSERGDEIEHVKGWTWLVPSSSGDVLYGVDLNSETCECPDFEGRGLPCEHVYRALHKAQAIRERLGGSANMMEPFPEKPKGLHWRTYERLWWEHHEAEMEQLIGARRWLDKLEKKVG
jgi:SWIM zinc finger